MIDSISQAQALRDRCQSTTSVNELSAAIDELDQFINAIDYDVVAAEKERDRFKGIAADRKVDKRKVESLRDALKRQRQQLRDDMYALRP